MYDTGNNNQVPGSRRDFLKKAALAGAGTVLGTSILSEQSAAMPALSNNRFSLLITADIHAQLNTHDEFFWENGKAVYRKRGGPAVLKTMIA